MVDESKQRNKSLMKAPGRVSRSARLTQDLNGGWVTTSVDFACLAERLYEFSREESSHSENGNESKLVFAGIPMLFASLRCLMIEYERHPRVSEVLRILTEPDDFRKMLGHYHVSGDLLDEI